MIRALAFLWTISFTAPWLNADGSRLVAPREFHVYRLSGQSATYKLHEASIRSRLALGKADTLAAYWSAVRAECAPVLVASYPFSVAQESTTVSLSVSDTTHALYITRATNSCGESAWSNVTVR